MSKICNKCNIEKELEEFSPLAKGKHGRRAACKICQAAITKLYREKNPEASRAAAKKYRKSKPEVISRKNKKYYATHKESVLRSVREWRKNNVEKTKEHSRRHNSRRRARRLNNGVVAYTEPQMLELYGTNCYLCGSAIDLTAPRKPGVAGWEQGLHIEHLISIVNGGTDSIENVRPAHGVCNLRKGKL